MHEIMSDAEAMRYWSSLPHGDREVTAKWFEEMLTEASGRDLFVAEHEGRVVGRLGIWQVPEVTFIFHPNAWGQGLAYEAVSALITHTFATRDTDRLTADVDPRNERSLRLLGKLGFVETHRAERTFCVAGEWADSVYLELKRDVTPNSEGA
jgi:[ribosomal protein S5]-alanine N-acetyltransferase